MKDRSKLTEKEKEIIYCICNRKCFTRKALAEELNISVNTVALHLSKIYLKLNIESNISSLLFECFTNRSLQNEFNS